MFKINDLIVDVTTNELILVTNGIALDMSKPEEYVPYEGLVFSMENNKMITWNMQVIQNRKFRKATEDEKNNLLPQFKEKLEEIRKDHKK